MSTINIGETPHERDIRASALYLEAESLVTAIRRPGTGQISDAADLDVRQDGGFGCFAGAMVDRLEGSPATRVCTVSMITGETRVMTFGPNTDRQPKYAPDGRQIAFLSDRAQKGNFQLYLLDTVSGAARATPSVSGWIEYLRWSPDGTRILLGVAGHGADIAGGQGAIASQKVSAGILPWMPAVDIGDEEFRWRRAWIYELSTNRVWRVSGEETNVWEANWCGNTAIATVASRSPGEGLWYSARLHVLDVSSGASYERYAPEDQIGWPTATASGDILAIVEAVCSDRWYVAGDLKLIDTASGKVRRVDTRGVDVSHLEWRSERRLLLAGHRGLESVIGMYDLCGERFIELWASREVTTGGFHITVSGFGEEGDCALIGEGFTRAPEVAVVRGRKYRPVRSFDLGYGTSAQAVISSADEVHWRAPDGLEVQGWLLRPLCGRKPYPLITIVHGGPVGNSRPRCLDRLGVFTLMLLKRGFAIFLPNPRGSTGRGLQFAALVRGDLGGAETGDHLSGLDHLVDRGLADPTRLGVTGVSHGGFMASWLITQSDRFSAAVVVAPVTNYVTQRLISNIPEFVDQFLADSYMNPTGRYFQRSPVMHAHRVKTPTLNICGALDRCTPPEEAVQFHHALLKNGVTSMLVTYPEEGHGVRKWPAMLDYATRLVAWFKEHLSAEPVSMSCD